MEDIGFDDEETIREFLVECHENLSRLDQDMVELEKRPQDTQLLAAIFRTMHTLKGTAGFLAFSNLEKLAHQAENLLSQLRDGKRQLNSDLVSLILETVDSVRKILSNIEATGKEGAFEAGSLVERLRAAAVLEPVSVAVAAAPVAVTSPSLPPQEVPQASVRSVAPPPEVPPAAPIATEPAEAPKAPKAAKKPNAEPKPKAPKKVAAVAAPASVSTEPAEPAVEDPAPLVVAEKPRSKAEDKAKAEEEDRAKSAAADSNIRVGVGLLDKLMDLVGELVLTRNQILQYNAQRDDATLNATSQRLNLITSELQEGVMKTRMQPIGVVWNSLPRVVRDMAVALGKQIEIKMEGAGTELDRTIIEAIKDPLVHIVRNSCDHGIETPEKRIAAGKPAKGTMMLRAYHEGGQVNIEVADNGGGVNLARVREKALEKGLVRPDQLDKMSDREITNLIFLPGFSTAQKISNISGRGVGMDVVKSSIERIGGVVDLSNQPGEGTTVKIRIPLTLAIIPGLIVVSGGERFVIPQVSLIELIRLEGDGSGKHIEYVHGTPVYRRRGTLLPVAYLNQVLNLNSRAQDDALSMVVLQADDHQFGLVVDGINDTQEIVVKALGKQLKGLNIYAGATIMGDGQVALILDVTGVGQRSGVFAKSHEKVAAAEEVRADAMTDRQQTLLLFKAGSFERVALPLSLVARLEEFPQSAIEHASGGQVIQYRNRILPLFSLRSILEPGAADVSRDSDTVPVIVFNDGDHAIGMVVDQILDVVDEAVNAKQTTPRKGLLGSAVVGGRVTDFLDLNAVLTTARETWFRQSKATTVKSTVLLFDQSTFSRGLIKNLFDMEGYSVIETSTSADALRKLDAHNPQLVVVSLDHAGKGAEFVHVMRAHSAWNNTPVLGLVDANAKLHSFDYRAEGIQDCQDKLDTTSIVRSASELIANDGAAQPELELAEAR